MQFEKHKKAVQILSEIDKNPERIGSGCSGRSFLTSMSTITTA